MISDKRRTLVRNVKDLLEKAGQGLRLDKNFLISQAVLPKLREVISTKRILHDKIVCN